jgi:hypothetical protein
MDPFNNRQADGANITWSDNYIHDVKRMSSGHIECLTYDAGTNVSFLRNLWKNCDVFDIFNKPVQNTSGLIDHNAFWEPSMASGNNANVAIRTASGATRCDTVVSNNWFGDGTTGSAGLGPLLPGRDERRRQHLPQPERATAGSAAALAIHPTTTASCGYPSSSQSAVSWASLAAEQARPSSSSHARGRLGTAPSPSR